MVTQTTAPGICWSNVPEEIVCTILSMTPESALSMRLVSRELNRTSATFLNWNKQRLVKKCSHPGSPLSHFLCRSASSNAVQFHFFLVREIKALGIAECPETILTARQLDHYTLRIQNENLQRMWERIQPLFTPAIPPTGDIPSARTWLTLNPPQIPHLLLEEIGLTCLPLEIAHFTGLVKLFLPNNQLRELPPGALQGCGQLQELSLHNNQLGTLLPGAFDALHQLQRLYLNHNQITELPTGLFQPLKQLRLIFLQNNLLEALPPDTFAGLNQLQQLYLDSNRLRALPAGIFEGLSQLQTLQLQHNQLSDLPPNPFAGLISLQVLALFNNQLSRLSPTAFHPLDQLLSLSIYDNPRLLIPYNDLRVFENNIAFLKMMNAFFNHTCTCPFATFYQLAADDSPIETVKETFHTLSGTLKNAIFEGVYMEAGRPDTTDYKWGETHAFDNLQIFHGALKRVVRDKFEKMTDIQKNTLTDRVYSLACNEREAQSGYQTDPEDSTDPTHDNILRLIDAMHEQQIWGT